MTDHDNLDEELDTIDNPPAAPAPATAGVGPEVAYAKAHATIERNTDGTFDEKALIDEMVKQMAVLDDRRRRAKEYIDRRRRPGSTAPDGQLAMFDTEPYDYEPERLIATDDGRLIENKNRLAPHSTEKARRSMKLARHAMKLAARDAEEAAAHQGWTLNRLEAGEERNALTFGRMIIDPDINAWRPDPSAQGDTDDQ